MGSLGALSAEVYEERAVRGRALFSGYPLEVFEERHHFDPPHRKEPREIAVLLKEFWSRAKYSHALANLAGQPRDIVLEANGR